MIRLTADWVRDPSAQAVLALLIDAGFQAFFVGGCVRNAVLGLPAGDIDISTSATPDKVSMLAERAGFKVVPTGLSHGTVTVVAKAKAFEVTTFRRDVATDGRHADVTFSEDVREDALRRDFTMNALYADYRGILHDPLNGIDDARARYVRFIEDAGQRICEDYLRILRYFRFHALYGDPAAGMDPEALAACAMYADGLDSLSKERVGAEIRKLLSALDPAPAMAAMAQTGVLARVLSGASATALPVLVHLEDMHSIAPDPTRRLALIGGEDVSDALRLSRRETRQLKILHEALDGQSGLAELAWRHGAQIAQDVALVRSARVGQSLPENFQMQISEGVMAEFPISAVDLSTSGAELGAQLRDLERVWIESGFKLSRDDLLK